MDILSSVLHVQIRVEEQPFTVLVCKSWIIVPDGERDRPGKLNAELSCPLWRYERYSYGHIDKLARKNLRRVGENHDIVGSGGSKGYCLDTEDIVILIVGSQDGGCIA